MISSTTVEAALRGLVLGCWLCHQHQEGLPVDGLTSLQPDSEWKERLQQIRGLVLPKDSGLPRAVENLAHIQAYLNDAKASSWLVGSAGAFLVDLFILSLLTDEGAEQSWDDSAWDQFENACAGLGTDLLHLLHYVDECREEGVAPGMDDFVDSFVVSPELEDQDHLMAYEEVLASRDLVHEPWSEMLAECRAMAPESAIEPVFTGLFVFLRQDSTDQAWLREVWGSTEDLSDFMPLLTCVQAYATSASTPQLQQLADLNPEWSKF